MAWFICVLLAFFSTTATAAEIPALKIKGDLPSIRATYADISRLTKDILEIATRSNSDYPKGVQRSFRVAGPRDALEVRFFESLVNHPALPDPATEFQMRCYGDQPLASSIDIEMSPRGWSSYRLSGFYHLMVPFMRTRLDEFASLHGAWFGGFRFSISVFLILMNLTFFYLYSLVQGKRVWWQLLATVVAFVFLYPLGYQQSLFPHTAIYVGSPAFYDRYAGLIALLSLFIGLIPLIPLFRRNNQSPSAQ